MAVHAKDVEVVLHVGLHKTATTYLQNVLSARRYDLVQHGLLYPTTGTVEQSRIRTREGAQSGHLQFTRDGDTQELVDDLLHELPPGARTVMLSAEDFSLPDSSPAEHLARLSRFGRVTVVAVLRRQDAWIESYYKQIVDQYGRFETRSLAEFLSAAGPRLLDFEARLGPWRTLVGPDAFHVLSYDDLPDGAAIARRLVEIAGVDVDALGDFPGVEVPRYDSIRAVDTVGLRILNSYRLKDRNTRNRIARDIYAASPTGDLTLMTPAMREGIRERFAPLNERIESEWFDEPVPGLCFRTETVEPAGEAPSTGEMMDLVDRVMSWCEQARRQEKAGAAP